MLNTRDRKHLINPLYYEFKEVPDLWARNTAMIL